jgi:hypothetical protein
MEDGAAKILNHVALQIFGLKQLSDRSCLKQCKAHLWMNTDKPWLWKNYSRTRETIFNIQSIDAQMTEESLDIELAAVQAKIQNFDQEVKAEVL